MDKDVFCILARMDERELEYYIEKGLISLNKKEDFDINNQDKSEDDIFSDENLYQARIINILKYLEFNLDEIEYLNSKNYLDVEEELDKKLLTYTKNTYDVEKKKEIIEVLKVSGFEEKIIECYAFGFSENKKGRVKNTETIFTSLGYLIYITMLVGAVLIDVFMGIKSEIKELSLVKILMTIVGSIYCIYSWNKYIKNCKKYKNVQKKINKKSFGYIPRIIIYIVFIIGSFVLFNFFPIFFVGENSYMYQIDYRIEIIFIINMLIWGVVVHCILSKKEEIKSRLKRFLLVAWMCVISGIISVLLSYNVTEVTKDSIIIYSTFNVKGTKYSYKDVESVDASFGKKTCSLTSWKRKGNFSYIITIDNKKVVFIDPTENNDIKRYEDLEYVALEDFDTELMKLGVPKTGDDKYSKYCDETDNIIKRYIRIINNK